MDVSIASKSFFSSSNLCPVAKTQNCIHKCLYVWGWQTVELKAWKWNSKDQSSLWLFLLWNSLMMMPIFYRRGDVFLPKLPEEAALSLFHFPWKWNVGFFTCQINSLSTSLVFFFFFFPLCFPNECLLFGSITEKKTENDCRKIWSRIFHLSNCNARKRDEIQLLGFFLLCGEWGCYCTMPLICGCRVFFWWQTSNQNQHLH